MKILIIARGIPNSHDPQEGCFEWDQAKALSSIGHEVVVMAVDGRVRKYWRKLGINNVYKDNINSYKIFYFPTSIIRRLVSFKIAYCIDSILAKKLYQYITKKHGNFDIIHSHYLPSSFLGAVIKKRFGGRLVATEHWSELKREPLSDYIKYLGDYTYPKVDALISVSDHLGKSIKKIFNIDYHVVYNLLDTSNLKKALKKTQNSRYTIIAVGSLVKIKGFDILINAYAKSNLRNQNSVLKIIGNGPEYSSLNSLIQLNGLSDKVILCGQKSKEEVYEELHSADLYVLSSRSENFSVALIEATANGVPSIGTLCGGVQEYPIEIRKVRVGDIDAMSKALDECYLKKDNFDRIKLQEETVRYFSPKIIAKQIQDIYQSTLNLN